MSRPAPRLIRRGAGSRPPAGSVDACLAVVPYVGVESLPRPDRHQPRRQRTAQTLERIADVVPGALQLLLQLVVNIAKVGLDVVRRSLGELVHQDHDVAQGRAQGKQRLQCCGALVILTLHVLQRRRVLLKVGRLLGVINLAERLRGLRRGASAEDQGADQSQGPYARGNRTHQPSFSLVFGAVVNGAVMKLEGLDHREHVVPFDDSGAGVIALRDISPTPWDPRMEASAAGRWRAAYRKRVSSGLLHAMRLWVHLTRRLLSALRCHG
ncbi:hypothetical protein BN13_210021 [Nostocoides jenkinsii Ben 74]|uniref:Uncharacterized protein n=1 Tax=Nostocoides jenkinsii Ben 74 TaxID=1193518 RepID=A0A077MD59_9MICO|nr:hypothetical protein BN13_210021 [Tetrasphaera jenkinsii Ben 74]